MTFDINPKQLKVFYYVAQDLSFAKAAKHLFVTQPAVRMQVDALEHTCGTRFLSREGRKLRLTEEGRTLFRYAEQLVDALDQAERAVQNFREHPHGILRLGTTKTWARNLMPTYLLRFRRLYPRVEIQLVEGTSEETCQHILESKIDLAIVARTTYHHKLKVKPFPGQHADELVLITHPDHPLRKKQEVTADDLRDQPFIMKVRGSGTRLVLDQYFAAQGISPPVLLEAGSVPFIVDLVTRNEGISALAYLGVEEEERQGRLATVSFQGQGLWLNIDVVQRRDGQLPDAAQRFLQFLSDSGEELLHGTQAAV